MNFFLWRKVVGVSALIFLISTPVIAHSPSAHKTAGDSSAAAATANSAGTAAPPVTTGTASPSKNQILASFSILGDLARQVAPKGVVVEDLVGAGEDSHQYQVTGKDLRDMKNARLVLQIGQGFEPWLEKSLRSLTTKPSLITVTDGLTLRLKDPHVWQDPLLAKKIVQSLAETFRREFPAQSAEISQREAAYLKELEDLDQDLKNRFAQIPAEQKVAITSHDAFGYFAQAYGLQFAAPQDWSTEADPSAKAIAKIVRQIRQKKARALFVEELTNQSVMQQISKETGVRIGGTLYSDSLSKSAEPAGTYLKMIRFNADTILSALQTAK